MVYAATLTLPWMASQTGPGPGALDTNLSLSLLLLPPACHLCQGLCAPPAPPHQKLVPVGRREMVQGPSKPFSSCHRALAWEQPKVREDAGGKVPFTLARSSCGCSLRVKGKVRACERRKQPSESPRLAWGKEDEAAAPGRPARGGS